MGVIICLENYLPVSHDHFSGSVWVCSGRNYLGLILMHIASSIFFIYTLIATYLCMETQFPHTDENGNLPGDYYTHQLATSLDYAPTNKIYNFFLGGFNSHAAHHLYPKLPHTAYPEISIIIEKKAKEYNVPYNKLN